MKFTLLLYGDENRWAEMSPEETAEDMQRWGAFYEELAAAGAFIAGEGLDATASATTVRVKAGEAYGRIEHSKGELGYYVVSNGSGNPWRYRVRSPSYINLNALADMCRGGKVADTIVTLGAIDIVLGEVDR